MRFPFALSAKIAGHIIRHKLRKTPKFAMVLQLEPLHTCNLTCTGCGRIREYSTSLKDMVPLEKCLAVAQECDAPMVSICGGEPLIYPKVEELVNGLLAQGRVIYVCTNGVFMRKKMRDYLAFELRNADSGLRNELENKIEKLLAGKLISEQDAATIRDPQLPIRNSVIRPTQWMYWNVHVDGLEFTHDLIVEREGVFKECIEAIKMAKILGFQVATNATIYKETDMAEIEDMFKFLSSLGVDGHTISPGYDYDAAKKDMVKRLGKDPKEFFLTRDMTRQKFAKILDWGKAFTIFGTPVYQEFLAGKRELTCTAWAIPTYNIKGWKAPCYLMTDGHYDSYQEMLEKVDWNKYGVVDGKARDPRCEHCMVHCGYDPSGALGTNYQAGDNWKNFKYNFWPRPKPYPASPELARRAYNGVSIGKGHLAEAKAAINSPAAGARGAFSNNGQHEAHVGTFCGSDGDTSQRDDLLAKIKEAKKA
ncbi:MAG TPA: adenosyl-hopene transferase HpnH [Candidatus Acidoferrum sp.]|nr:adenosyl-hopene transferase HpnH [Candidatus Acidoferrum sp.]